MNASAWTHGYATDEAYTAGFYFEQSPEHLNHACVLNGVEPVPLDRPFTYLELGCGLGMTALMLAASHPNGRFYAADFMPAHIAGAQQLADAAGLDNISLLESSFAQLADGEVDLPPLDFITLHGVYTWVSAARRAEIVRFIARYLKPGGIVYISYNTLPGWAPAMPVRRLMRSHAAEGAGGSAQRLQAAQSFIEKMIHAKAGFFEANPGLADQFGFLPRHRAATPYLVHEYMHTDADPMYHADVAHDLLQAKLDYVGQATLGVALHKLPAEQQQLLNEVADPVWRETLRDFMMNTRFRKDVFVRGRRSLPPGQQRHLLSEARLALLRPRSEASLGLDLPKAEKDDPQEAVLDALAVSPCRLGELARLACFGGQLDAVSLVSTVMGGGLRHGAVFLDDRSALDAAAARRFNRAVGLQARHIDLCPGFASPLIGNGFRATLLEQLVYAQITEEGASLQAQAVAAGVLPYMQAHFAHSSGRSPDSLTVDDILGAVEQILVEHVPLWRQLRAL